MVIIGVTLLGWVLYPKVSNWLRSKPTATVERSCEAWSKKYAVIPWNEFPGDTLRVGRGEEWVIRLSPTDTSGVIILDPRARDNWTFPTGITHKLFPDGLHIVDAPGKSIERGKRNTFRAWGEGCLLVRVSGT